MKFSKANKRGISPLIATVLLIGFTVALAVLIGTFLIKFGQKTSEEAIDFVEGTSDCNKISISAEVISLTNYQDRQNQLTFNIFNRGYLGVDGVYVRLFYRDGEIKGVEHSFGSILLPEDEIKNREISIDGLISKVEFIPLRNSKGCSDKKTSVSLT